MRIDRVMRLQIIDSFKMPCILINLRLYSLKPFSLAIEQNTF